MPTFPDPDVLGGKQKAQDIAGSVGESIRNGSAIAALFGDSHTVKSGNNAVSGIMETIRQLEGRIRLAGGVRNADTDNTSYASAGWTSNQIVTAMQTKYDPSFKYNVWFYKAGYNDRTSGAAWTSGQLANLKSNLRIMTQAALENGAQLIITAEYPHQTNHNTSSIVQLAAYNRFLARWCERHEHCTFIPAHQVITDPATGLLNGSYEDDTLHLNRDGSIAVGELGAAILKGDVEGIEPYLVVSDPEAFTSTDPEDGAALALNSGNLTGQSTTGLAATGMTVSIQSFPSGSWGVGGAPEWERTSSGDVTINNFLNPAPVSDFWSTGERIRASARVFVQTDNVWVEMRLNTVASIVDAHMYLTGITQSIHGDIYTQEFDPDAAWTRIYLEAKTRDWAAYSTARQVRVCQPTIFNLSRVDALVDEYALW